MSKKIIIFIRYQLAYLVFLLCLFVLPLGVFFKFSPYPLEKIQYFFMAALLVSQWYIHNENNFYNKIRSSVVASLKKELGKIPSSKDINARSLLIRRYRIVCIGFALFCIFLVMLYFGEF